MQNLGNFYIWGPCFVISRTDAQNRVDIIFNVFLLNFAHELLMIYSSRLTFYLQNLNDIVHWKSVNKILKRDHKWQIMHWCAYLYLVLKSCPTLEYVRNFQVLFII